MNATTYRTTPQLPPVVFATDENYVKPLCVAIRSVGHHYQGDEPLTVIVLHAALSKGSADKLRRHGEDVGLNVELRSVNALLSGYPTWGSMTSAAYLRLTMGSVLADCARALYLDCDLLVKGNLAPLLLLDTRTAAIAAVQDTLVPIVRGGPALPGWRKLGLDGTREYFNSGVMLFDFAACREQEIFERSFWFLDHRREHVKFFDQCALNWAADDRWLRLPRFWNTYPLAAWLDKFGGLPFLGTRLSLEAAQEDERAARVLHFVGPVKPWSAGYPECAARALYADAAAELEAAER
jgi:lipopolysaccharide biosynthesis glycosyltransferase